MANYHIVTTCIGPKYEPILPHWSKRVIEMCPNMQLHVIDSSYLHR